MATEIANTIFQSMWSRGISTMTQSQVIDCVIDVLKYVVPSYHDDIIWHIGYAILRSGVYPIPDGTYDYILTPVEIQQSPTFNKTEQILAYMKRIVEPRGFMYEDVPHSKSSSVESVVPELAYCTYIDISLTVEDVEEIFDRQDIIVDYEGIKVKMHSCVYFILAMVVTGLLYGILSL